MLHDSPGASLIPEIINCRLLNKQDIIPSVDSSFKNTSGVLRFQFHDWYLLYFICEKIHLIQYLGEHKNIKV